MDQLAVTAVCAFFLAACLLASYLRHKRQNQGNASESTQSVSDIMKETSEYFGFDVGPKGGINKALDLAPMQMASSLTNQTNQTKKRKSKRKK